MLIKKKCFIKYLTNKLKKKTETTQIQEDQKKSH